MKLGLIGNGAIAEKLASYCGASGSSTEIACALALNREKRPAGNYILVDTLPEFLAFDPELVVECASHDAVKQYGASILQAGIDLIVTSVGALCDEETNEALRRARQVGGSRMILPSGALAGLESLATAAVGGLDAVTLRSCKPPRAWRGTEAERSLDLNHLESPTLVFDGTAREAARLFPKNANVAASVALFGIGFERTRVVLVADPKATRNTHVLEAQGAFGRLRTEIEGIPMPANPKSSFMTALSIIKCLETEASNRKARRRESCRGA